MQQSTSSTAIVPDAIAASGTGGDYTCGLVEDGANDYYDRNGSTGHREVYDWQPQSDKPVGPPDSVTESAGYNGTGINHGAGVPRCTDDQPRLQSRQRLHGLRFGLAEQRRRGPLIPSTPA
jgi:hypothetical protein